MNPQYEEAFTLAVLKVLEANNTSYGLGAPAICLHLRQFGFAPYEGDVLDRLEYLTDHGTAREVVNRVGNKRQIIGMLEMSNMRLPEQQAELDLVCSMPKFNRAEIDMTGIGLGLVEYAQDKWGTWKIRGVQFASTEPINEDMRAEGRKQEKAPVTEVMASDMLGVFEARQIEIPNSPRLRADLLKPEKITTPSGRVSIAAVRDIAGHADRFWSVALAIRAGMTSAGPAQSSRVKGLNKTIGPCGLGRNSGIIAARK